MATESMLTAELETFLVKSGFSKYSGSYVGCPLHAKDGLLCPCDEQGNSMCKDSCAPYWKINGGNVKDFISSLKTTTITYLFVEKTGEVRKIGEGAPKRVLDNLKAHYNHGLTKSSSTKKNRALSNSIAKKCRLAKDFTLYLKHEQSKSDAKATESMIKRHLSGWLDYDQGGTGLPTTI